MESSESGRPAKKQRTQSPKYNADVKNVSNETPKRRAQRTAFKRQQRRDELNHPQPESTEHRRDRELFGIDEDDDKEIGLKPLEDEEKEKLRKRHIPKTFSQPSVMSTGDRGIFVTCDKGKEKKCLTELADLVEDYLEKHDLIPAELVDPDALLKSRLDRQRKKGATIPVDNEDSPVEEEEIDIESSINAELSGMQSLSGRKPGLNPAKESTLKIRAFQLITLDIPCVSFLRFVPTSQMAEQVNVVDLVYAICAEAASNPGRMRSRYIRRLSPVTWLGKLLNEGLAKACETTLPNHFKVEESSDNAGTVTFAIKPTIRNSDKISRDDLIKHIADEVQKLGGNKHKVDLKGYQKAILAEVYRGWIGMSVVDNTGSKESNGQAAETESNVSFGYEVLKRFNLAEIHAEGLKRIETRT